MANWRLHCRDTAFGRVKSTEVTANTNAVRAAAVVDGNPMNIWSPASSTTVFFDFAAESTFVANAIAICNHNLSGETVTLYRQNSFGGSRTSAQSWTVPDNEDVVFVDPSPLTTSTYWAIGFSSLTTSQYIGELSVLDQAYSFTLDYPSAPRFPVAVSAQPGAAVLRTASGVPFEQVMGGVARPFPMIISVADFSVDTPGVGRQIHNWVREGINRRVWITDDTFGEDTANIGPGLYAWLPEQQGQIIYPTARGELLLPFEGIGYNRQPS